MMPIVAFFLGVLMGALGLFLVFVSLGASAAAKKNKEEVAKKELDTHMLDELFEKYLESKKKE